MTPKRKAAEAAILATLTRMEPGGLNAERYKEKFKSMSDTEFDSWMKAIRDKKKKLVLFAPNMKIALQRADLLKAAKALNVKLFERINLWDSSSKRRYLTPKEYLVLRLPVRRSQQMIQRKISTPESDRSINQLTGQVRKPDKGASLSMIEMKVLSDKGLTKTVSELVTIRGGNPEGYGDFRTYLEDSGSVSLKEIDARHRPRSIHTLRAYMLGMGLDLSI